MGGQPKLSGTAQLFNVEKSMEQYLLNESVGHASMREGTAMNESVMAAFDAPKKGISILTIIQNFEASSALKHLDISDQ